MTITRCDTCRRYANREGACRHIIHGRACRGRQITADASSERCWYCWTPIRTPHVSGGALYCSPDHADRDAGAIRA